ncbi:50S ribosomal protein L18 [Ktedonospora formicarum]|uniref:Large ribosomal subunit protein uL18 n=1 Tax=Ktedonospora formicarum TaxID=2778364 RepID=A0A8J3MQK4_9CHLR|nr:hypothetical protein KSX_22130 [Ktedonospora formicarum]
MIKKFHANQARLRRHQRIRRHLEGSETRPRLNVFRSGQHIYAQVVNDATGITLVSASSLDETLRNFELVAPKQPEKQESAPVVVEEQANEAPAASGKKAAKGGRATATMVAAPKKEKKSQLEQLAGIADNRKVALAREVGKLVAQRAQEKGVKQVVFDRGGYAYHGRVAALAEGAREGGLDF